MIKSDSVGRLFSLNVSNPKLVYARHLGYISVEQYGHKMDLEMGGVCVMHGGADIRSLGLYT